MQIIYVNIQDIDIDMQDENVDIQFILRMLT